MDRTETPADGLPRPAAAEPPALRDLFIGFLGLGLTGFGGLLPFARRVIVEERGWLTAAEFTELLGLCQFMPGGNILNMSVAIGLQFRGIPGAVAALAGLMAAPTVVVLALGAVYDRYRLEPHVEHLFAGLAAAAAGLLIGVAIKIAVPLRTRPFGLVIAALCILSVVVLHQSILPTMLVLVPISVALTRKWNA